MSDPIHLDRLATIAFKKDLSNMAGTLRYSSHLILEHAATNVKISAMGHIIILGECENSFIRSEYGNVFILGGASYNTDIQAAQNIYVKHCSRSELKAGRDIIIEASVVRSKLVAAYRILTEGSESEIVGGECIAGHQIQVQTLGSATQIATSLYLQEPTGEILAEHIYPQVEVRIGSQHLAFQERVASAQLSLQNNRVQITKR